MRRYWIILFCTVAAIAVAGVAALRQREPVYQGKSLSTWLSEATEVNTGGWPRRTSVPADDAIRQIGTNAFPMIVELLRSRDSVLKSKLVSLLNRQSLFPTPFTTQRERYYQAITACYALGPVAKPLVPEVANALQHMGGVQPFAEQWLSELGPGAEAAIPALIAILRDKKNPARFMAAQNLALIAIYRRDEVLPVFNECLQDTNSLVNNEARHALRILEEGGIRY